METNLELVTSLFDGFKGSFTLVFDVLIMTLLSFELEFMSFLVHLFVEIDRENDESCHDQKKKYVSECVISALVMDDLRNLPLLF